MKKRILLAVLAMAVFSSGLLTASAFTGTRKLDAYFNNIKVIVDGREVDLRDANGEPVEPFIVNGSTYLPVRGVVNAITGVTVALEWDPIGYRVLIGDCKTGKVGIQEFVNVSGQRVGRSNSEGSFSFINRGVTINPYNYFGSLFSSNETHVIALEGRYARITGTVARPGVGENPLKIYGDDVLLGEYRHNGSEQPPIDIDLTIIGVKTLRIENGRNGFGISHFYNVDLERLG